MGAFLRRMRLSVQLLLSLILWVAGILPWARAETFGDPRGFLLDEEVEAVDLDGGMRWYRVSGIHEGVPQVIHVVTVDLGRPNLNAGLLRGNRLAVAPTQFHLRSTVSQLLEDNSASLAINASFFDIGATQTPFGLLIDEQDLLRTPASNRTVLALTRDKQVHVGSFTAVVLCRHGGAAPLINSVNGNNIAENSLHLYRHPWERSPGSEASIAKGMPLTEVVFETGPSEALEGTTGLMRMHGRVMEVRDGMDSVRIGSGQAVLTASGSLRDFVRGMSPGEDLEILWRLTGGGLENAAWNIQVAVAGSAHLVIGGAAASANTAHWNDRHPRSAVGVAADRQRMAVVLVEGRMTGRAEGLSLHSVARLLLHLGAQEGLELDGGGSSALAGRINGEAVRLSEPSGGTERYVPVGLGVFETPSSTYPFFEEVRASASDREAVVTWSTPEPVVSHAVLDGESGILPGAVPRLDQRHGIHLVLDPSRTSGLRIRLMAERSGEWLATPPITVTPGEDDTTESDPPAWWMRHFFGKDVVSADADSDADGFSNAVEFGWGTDPTHPLAKPDFSIVVDVAGPAALRFAPYLVGRSYRLWSMQPGDSGFVSEAEVFPLPDSSGGATFPIIPNTGNRLYRVEALLTP